MGHDGDLADGLGILLLGRHQSVAHLVIGDDALFLLGDDGALLLGACDDGFKGRQQVVLVHGLAALAHGPQGRLVHQVRQVRAHAACGGLGDLVQVHVLRQADVPGVDLQGGKSARQIGPVHGDAPVEAAGPQQGLVQHLRPVGGSQHDNALAGVEAVQLRQQLVQSLLSLVVAAEASAVPGFADGVDLVDEDDAGSHLGGLLEQVTDPGRAHAHEHLHKVRAGDGEERHVGLAGHGLGQQRFAGAGGAYQQRALGELGADGGVFAGVVEEVDDLLQGLLGLILTGHVLEGDAGLLFHIHLGVGLAHVADAADAPAVFGCDPHHQQEQSDHQHHRQDIHHQDVSQDAPGALDGAGILHIVLIQQRQQPGVRQIGGIQGQLGLFALGIGLGLPVLVVRLFGIGISVHRGGVQYAVLQLDLLDLVLLHQVHHLAVGDLKAPSAAGGGQDVVEYQRQHQGPANQRDDAAQVFVVFLVSAVSIVSVV